MKFTEKIQEFIYSISTNDKYSEYDSRKSFNRVNRPDSERNLLYSHHNNSTNDFIGVESENNVNNIDGVHEVHLAWRHIKTWLNKYMPDILSSLQEHCTDDDLSDFQRDLGIRLPNALLEFFKLTDGQSNYGYDDLMGGLFFGLKLMSLDEIMIETENWRKISKVLNQEILLKHVNDANEIPKLPNTHNSSSQYKKKFSSSGTLVNVINDLTNMRTPKQQQKSIRPIQHLPTQKCIPPGAIHETFAHPMWIPLVTDEIGNYVGVDLSPPSKGTGNWGQIILFGRDFDTKFKIASNWGDFLLIFANDIETGNWEIKKQNKNNYGDLIIGSEGDFVYYDKQVNLHTPYFDALKKKSLNDWLNSLSEDEREKELVKELTESISPSSDTKSYKNTNSIDSYINNNLASMDEYNNPTILTSKKNTNMGIIEERKSNSNSPVSDDSKSNSEGINSSKTSFNNSEGKRSESGAGSTYMELIYPGKSTNLDEVPL